MIIGLCGYKGSGKSEVAKYLAENYKFKRVNFKDALVAEMKEKFPKTLKEIAYSVSMLQQYETGIGESLNTSDMFELKPPLMRALMQEYGTEVRRGDDENYWAKQWEAKVDETKGNIVTDDVRFFNELSALTEKDGILIRVVREDITEGGDHQSEKEQEKFIEDFTVVAVKGDILGMHRQIDKIINHIKAD